jgi:methyltransferase
MTWNLLYAGVVLFVIAQRLAELVVSNRNVHRLRLRGGVEFGADHYPWMVALHVAFLASCVAEPWLLDRPVRPRLAVAMLIALGVGMGLRAWTLATLGDRWTTRVMVVPGEVPVTSGPYRFLKHPNYIAVVIEIIAIPMIHTAWLTATVFTVLNAGMLYLRISTEERALIRFTAWDRIFDRPARNNP